MNNETDKGCQKMEPGNGAMENMRQRVDQLQRQIELLTRRRNSLHSLLNLAYQNPMLAAALEEDMEAHAARI